MPHNITDSAWTGPDLKPEEEKRAAQKTLAVLEEMADVFKRRERTRKTNCTGSRIWGGLTPAPTAS